MTSDRGGIRALVTAFATAGAFVGLTYAHPALSAYRPWSPGDPLPVVAALMPRAAPRVVEDVNGLSLASDAGPAPTEVDAGDVPAPTQVDAEPTDAVDVAAGADADSTDGADLSDAPDGAEPDADGVAEAPAADPDAARTGDGDPAAATLGVIPVGPLPSAAGMPERPPGVATALVDAEHRGMDVFYRALHRAANGAGLARASHYGDSTIAADGITSTVRARLQRRFGDGGPGYLSAGMDPRWNFRRDVTTSRDGTWDTVSLLLGGGNGRYSYGGIVSTAAPEATLAVTAPKGTTMQRFELWFQGGAERGRWWVTLDGKPAGAGNAAAEATVDLRHTVDVPEGYRKVAFGATGAPVPFYGIVMETGGPGVVWDALGVVGVGSRSFTQHSRRHLASQVAQRDPDLVVVMLGGNELGLPALGKGDGSGYVPYFTDTLRRLRAGAPDAACLVITPVDQGTREGDTPRTKPNLPRLVAAQRKAAANEGCAFWNAWAAMGGPDSIIRWSTMKPPLAWTDLNHLSKAGQDIVGNLLADAIEHGYDGWLAAGGPARPAPVSPTPSAEAGAATSGASADGAPAPTLDTPPPAAPAAPEAP